jgi:pimeloyl-ACP methyl ester carboxylesterase
MTMPASSHTVDLDGPTHYLDLGGPSEGPLILAVHGLGGAAWNWLAIAPLLTRHCRLIAIDLAGHGLTPAAGRSTTVDANLRLLDRFIREVVTEPVVLMGNSMGGLITLLQSANSPDVVRGAILVDPAIPRPLREAVNPWPTVQFALAALPGMGQAALNRLHHRRQTVEQQIRQTLTLCTVDYSRVPTDVIDEGVRSIKSRNPRDFTTADGRYAGRSLLKLLSRPQFLRQAFGRVQAPVLLVHGDRDLLIPVSAARAAKRDFPHWRLEIAKNVGHVPMLEDAVWTAEMVLDWLSKDADLLAV